jgi:hypothetical protein
MGSNQTVCCTIPRIDNHPRLKSFIISRSQTVGHMLEPGSALIHMYGKDSVKSGPWDERWRSWILCADRSRRMTIQSINASQLSESDLILN